MRQSRVKCTVDTDKFIVGAKDATKPATRSWDIVYTCTPPVPLSPAIRFLLLLPEHAQYDVGKKLLRLAPQHSVIFVLFCPILFGNIVKKSNSSAHPFVFLRLQPYQGID